MNLVDFQGVMNVQDALAVLRKYNEHKYEIKIKVQC